MRYMGGKVRIAKSLVPVLQGELQDRVFVDMFCGSCNIVSAIKANVRIANDIHSGLIALHKAVQSGWIPPTLVTETDYENAKSQPDPIKSFIGFGCSFSGKYFGGYARSNEGRNYAMNAKNSLLKKHSTMQDVVFTNSSYSDLPLPKNSLIYCDIPYKGTTTYSTGAFDHESFYSWCKTKQSEGHKVLVSEYAMNVPEGWKVIWEYESKKDMRNKQGTQVQTREVIMHPS